MDHQEQRDHAEERAVRADLEAEGEAERAQEALEATPDTFEWHTARAREAIDREELDLAHAHLYLAAELQNAIAARGARWRKLRGLPEGVTGPEAARLWRMIMEEDPQRTREVPLIGKTRDEHPRPAGEQPAWSPHWHATAEPTNLDAPEHSSPSGAVLPMPVRQPGQSIGRRTCQTCGVVIAWMGNHGPGTRVVHLDGNGLETDLDHEPVP